MLKARGFDHFDDGCKENSGTRRVERRKADSREQGGRLRRHEVPVALEISGIEREYAPDAVCVRDGREAEIERFDALGDPHNQFR